MLKIIKRKRWAQSRKEHHLKAMLHQKYFNLEITQLGKTTAITGPTQFNKAHSLLGRKSITTSFRCFSFFFFLKSLVLIRPFRWRHSRVISPTKGSDLYLSAFYFSTLEFICGKQNWISFTIPFSPYISKTSKEQAKLASTWNRAQPSFVISKTHCSCYKHKRHTKCPLRMQRN